MEKSKLDEPIKAVCKCLREEKLTTFRSLKNKWITCSCKQPMTIKTEREKENAVSAFYPTD
jgi:hypothetical protein|tara:strand:+ start:469 stop:651 length:183 start_codon:yes stop_codon:yes gene_type:complete